MSEFLQYSQRLLTIDMRLGMVSRSHVNIINVPKLHIKQHVRDVRGKQMARVCWIKHHFKTSSFTTLQSLFLAVMHIINHIVAVPRFLRRILPSKPHFFHLLIRLK